jgi:hypothetical protein
VCLKGVGQQSGDSECLWIASLASFRGTVLEEIVQACAGLGGMAQQNGDHLCVDHGLGKPEGCGPAEQRSLRPVQA